MERIKGGRQHGIVVRENAGPLKGRIEIVADSKQKHLPPTDGSHHMHKRATRLASQFSQVVSMPPIWIRHNP